MPTAASAITGHGLQVDASYKQSTYVEKQSGSTLSQDRGYHSFTTEAYSLPNDSTEHQRLNIQDKTWKLTLHGGLHLAPISKSVTRAVDIGTGTGEWALDFARAHPQCQVLGTDLSGVKPSSDNFPGNIKFIVANANEEWDFDGQVDFIHSRMLTLGIRDWSAYFRRAYENLNPGAWVEVQETRFPGSYLNDGGVNGETSIYKFTQCVRDATLKLGVDVQASDHFRELLENAGFENIRYERVCWAVGDWPKGVCEKEIGSLTALNVKDYFTPALADGLLVNVLGWSRMQADEMIEQVRKDVDDPDIHFYFVFTLCCAQKPG